MDESRRAPLADSSLALLAKGYTWLPDRRARTDAPLVRTRLRGQHAVRIPLNRVPARVRNGFVIGSVRVPVPVG
ncbi:hypothetical protein ABTZ58_01830 [Streptomyces sp. NPDC094143]|uniref:hypothetical protein n=1 Tax=Streptomyces sp. NPDC094143 TaxID=3155310 RepID=UPI00332ECAE6